MRLCRRQQVRLGHRPFSVNCVACTAQPIAPMLGPRDFSPGHRSPRCLRKHERILAAGITQLLFSQLRDWSGRSRNTGTGRGSSRYITIPFRVNRLVCDHDLAVVALVSEALRTKGYQVLSTTSGGMAIAALAENEEIDLLLVDYPCLE
jgi:hypothetical protein